MTSLRKFVITLVVIGIACGGYLLYVIYRNVTQYAQEIVEERVTETLALVPRHLDGQLVPPELASARPYAVMIENHPDARPQAGLAVAPLVYEALTEGDITRFVAFFDSATSTEFIGPVRSARPYMIDIAAEWGGLYAHSGGSPAALDQLQTTTAVQDLNEFYSTNTKYFWRRPGHIPPHNLYTSVERLMQAADAYQTSTTTTSTLLWVYKDEAPLEGRPTTSVSILIPYSKAPGSQVLWRYNREDNSYERWQNNQPHTDENKLVIQTKNIIIQRVTTAVLDQVGRRSVRLIGEGDAVIFRDGASQTAHWKRPAISDRTRWYDDQGNEIALNRGTTWVEIVPVEMNVQY